MKTNTEFLMNALGWQGGTVHQVARETGLKLQTILRLDETKITDSYQLEMYNSGFTWASQGGKESTIPRDKRGYPLFWRGVLDAMRQKESEFIESNDDDWSSIDPGNFWEELAETEKQK